MEELLASLGGAVDRAAGACLLPLAFWILISGLDDVFLDCACLAAWLARRAPFRRKPAATETEAALAARQKRAAIFVPCWKEDAVIAHMVENNLSRVAYENYDFFIGVYPNDQPTLDVVRALAYRHPRVHMAVCPHDGPTSKADCLNWTYQRMMERETSQGCRYEIVITHDAEDVIHPRALHWINYYIDSHDMVQVPVLPLRTPWFDFIHGIYCDEFSEFQTKDMPGRQILRGFIPSNGVGTGFSRWGLEKLAEDRGRIFQPECLTEDYENGIRLHLLGCQQMFMPIRLEDGEPVATREYFPRKLGAAIRQRTRWVTGIALQTWERHGWRGGPGTVYWLWRDRKGLIGNPVSLLATLLFAYGACTWAASGVMHRPWGLGAAVANHGMLSLVTLTSLLQAVHLAVRMSCTARIYGWGFAAWAPVRTLMANYVNFRATVGAVWRYSAAKIGHKPLVWLKTDHTYPVAPASARAFTLAEILVSGGALGAADLESASAVKPAEMPLHDFLIARGLLDEDKVYDALSVLFKVPLTKVDPLRVARRVARALPLHLVESCRLLPFRVSGGHLFVASPEPPEEAILSKLARFTRLPVRYHLVTPSNFERLRQELL